MRLNFEKLSARNMKMSYQRQYLFDEYQKDRIINLLTLKGKCLSLHEKLAHQYHFAEPVLYNSFFLTISNCVDTLIYSFANDEAVTCLESRGATEELFDEIIEQSCGQEAAAEIAVAIVDYQAQSFSPGFRDRYIGWRFHDFTVDTYSAFETWVSRIYSDLKYEVSFSSERETKIRSHIAEFGTADSARQQQLLQKIAKLSVRQSGAGEIDFVFSKIQVFPIRDKKSDQQLIKSYAAMRNTIHNLGLSKAADTVELKGDKFHIIMASGSASSTLDHSDRTRLCSELVSIYQTIIDALSLAGSTACMVAIEQSGSI